MSTGERTPKEDRNVPRASLPFVHRIRAARLAQGMTDAVASKRLGMARASWWRVESGAIASPTLDMVHAMAGVVGLRLTLIPKGTPPPEYLPPLDGEQVRALALLATWYRAKNPGPIPRPLASAIEILRPYADREPHERAQPEIPRHARAEG